MIARLDSMGGNYIATSVYADKYGVNQNAVLRAARAGRIKSYTTRETGGGRLGNESVFVEDALGPWSRVGSPYSGDRKRCSRCMTWLEKRDYAPSQYARPKAPCRLCQQAMSRKASGKYSDVDALIDASNKAAEVERQYVLTDEQRSEREERVQAHAARIEAMGLAGDGKDWLHGE